jgi:hypothetical protein
VAGALEPATGEALPVAITGNDNNGTCPSPSSPASEISDPSPSPPSEWSPPHPPPFELLNPSGPPGARLLRFSGGDGLLIRSLAECGLKPPVVTLVLRWGGEGAGVINTAVREKAKMWEEVGLAFDHPRAYRIPPPRPPLARRKGGSPDRQGLT